MKNPQENQHMTDGRFEAHPANRREITAMRQRPRVGCLIRAAKRRPFLAWGWRRQATKYRPIRGRTADSIPVDLRIGRRMLKKNTPIPPDRGCYEQKSGIRDGIL
jgi:hypothetical protein